MSRSLVELCAGTASLTLWTLGRVPPLTGYMGSKRRWASVLSDAIGPVSEALLVDAGPWGDVWSVLRDRRARLDVAGILAGWQGRDPADIWRDLVARPPEVEPPARVAQYLWLQARSAGTIPIWWSSEHGRWESPSGSRTAGQCHAGSRQKSTPGGARGMIHPRTLALRVLALDAIDWSRVIVHHGDVRDVVPYAATAYMDPPYLGCPRYAELLPRADVLALALRWRAAGARVAVSEAEALPLEGWVSRRLARREWVTASWSIDVAEQLVLVGEAA